MIRIIQIKGLISRIGFFIFKISVFYPIIFNFVRFYSNIFDFNRLNFFFGPKTLFDFIRFPIWWDENRFTFSSFEWKSVEVFPFYYTIDSQNLIRFRVSESANWSSIAAGFGNWVYESANFKLHCGFTFLI